MGEVQDCLRLVNYWLRPTWENPEVDGKDMGWAHSGDDIESNPNAIGALTVGMNVLETRVEVRRVMLRDEDVFDVANEVVDEIENKVLQIINENRKEKTK